MSEKRDSSVDSKNQRDQHVFMWQSVKVSNVFNILTLNKFSGKWKRFSKTGVPLLVETTTIESNSFPSKTAVRNQYYDKLLWQLQNGSIIKSVVLPESTLFIFFFFPVLEPLINNISNSIPNREHFKFESGLIVYKKLQDLEVKRSRIWTPWDTFC